MCCWYTGCAGVIVIDSSSLITLAGAGALSLIALSPDKALTITQVYEETVEHGLTLAYPDATAIAHLFENQTVTIRDPARKVAFSGVSVADSLLLRLAAEVSASGLLTNDQKLWHKADQRGLPAYYPAEFVDGLHREKRISRRRRDSLLEEFVANRRYSRAFMDAFLLGR